MPPPRRRPVPSTPAYRPKVAGLRKQAGTPPAGTPSAAVEPVVEPTAPEVVAREPVVAPVVDSAPADAPEQVDAEPAELETAEPTVVESETAEPETAEAEVVEAEEDAGPATAKPVGRGERKSTGVPSPSPRKDAEADAESDAADAADTAEPLPVEFVAKGRSPLLLPLVLVLVAALLGGLGLWFRSMDRGGPLNEALVDTGGTTEVSGQAREAVEKAFSYNFADVDATEKAAGDLLVGKAKCQYDAIFGPVRSLAPEQKLVVTVKAVSSGVTSLSGDRATVLLFLDQVTTRTTDNQTGGGIAMMRVGAQRVDGRWKVDNMEMFGQTGDQAVEMQKCS
ncbi:hypothetical protein [Umezawaea sp. Da 62-37]|uniref:hypothetical protein n=1 Tax=Umezawaea sp. Da 62-37 TaxID=3075927 RepID=UPI0028F6CC01|nr:hypothetical protein [Umezawaea sp. Da 62-37]WNV90910.1 hypothetical protein RM788_22305 [Umezawaea sp. Da 62-37]